jgi:LemA protein
MLPLIFLFALPLGLALWAILLFNKMVAYRNECRSALAQVDVQLKRRADLLPKLVEVVKGAMKFESETLQSLMRERGRAAQAASLSERLDAEAGVGVLLTGLMGNWEAYPELKAMENAMELQREIASTENRIAFSRTYYNDVTANYNTLIASFPASLISVRAGFGRQPWFRDKPGG